jgi:predicted ArsR family transcriptional regulator
MLMNSLAVFSMSPVRIEIIRILVSHGEASIADLAAQLKLSRNGVKSHLSQLESEGVAARRQATHPRGSGPITYWRADIDEITEVFDSFRNLILEEVWY